MGKALAKAFGAELRARREKRGLSQEKLAEDAGLSRNYVGLVERGQDNPSLDTIEALADAVGASLSEVIAGAERRMR